MRVGRREVLTVLCLLAAGGFLSCDGNEQLEGMPPGLTGIWKSTEDRYSGCSLEISAISLRFCGVDDVVNDYYLLEAERVKPESEGFESAVGVKRPKGTQYLLRCRDTRDEIWEFHLIHTSGSRETLKFKNRSGKWCRG